MTPTVVTPIIKDSSSDHEIQGYHIPAGKLKALIEIACFFVPEAMLLKSNLFKRGEGQH